jgi:hypothetical protein
MLNLVVRTETAGLEKFKVQSKPPSRKTGEKLRNFRRDSSLLGRELNPGLSESKLRRI